MKGGNRPFAAMRRVLRSQLRGSGFPKRFSEKPLRVQSGRDLYEAPSMPLKRRMGHWYLGECPPGAVRPQVAHARERRSTCDAPIPTPLRSGDERWRYGAEVEANALAQRMYHPAPALWRRLSFASHICLLCELS